MSIVLVVSRIRRTALVVSAVAAAGALVAPAAGAAKADSETPAASVSRGVCTTSLADPEGRAASFTVRAAAGEATGTYGFTAVLQEKAPKGRWTTLTGSASPSGLGTFQPAAAGAASMVRKINVRGLRMGSAYRLKVSFRWTGATGKQTLTRRSSACTVRELRPNLGVAQALGWTPGTSGNQVVYRARLRVARASQLEDRAVTLSVLQGGVVLGSTTVQSLSNGVTTLVPGARCAAGRDVTIRIEAAPAVDERTLDDNELTTRCDATAAARR